VFGAYENACKHACQTYEIGLCLLLVSSLLTNCSHPAYKHAAYESIFVSLASMLTKVHQKIKNITSITELRHSAGNSVFQTTVFFSHFFSSGLKSVPVEAFAQAFAQAFAFLIVSK
jgi:hypothetical protein